MYGYRMAVVPHHIMQIPDAFFGTGLNRQGHVTIANENDARKHLQDCVHSPLDSGLVGFFLGQWLLRNLSEGAFSAPSLGRCWAAAMKP